MVVDALNRFEDRDQVVGAVRDAFVEALSDVPPKPAAMDQILRINQGREEVRS